MLGVLLAAAGDRSRPGWRDTADLLWGAARLHLRRVVAADGGIDPRDELAIVSLLGPVAILAGATISLHELAWWVKAGSLMELPWWTQVPDAPVWVVWGVVAVLALLGRQRAAAVGAWVGTAGFVLVAFVAPTQRWWAATDSGWVLLGALTAVALTWSPGKARARELVPGYAVVVLFVTVVQAVSIGVIAYREPEEPWWRAVTMAVGTVVACGVWSRVGRRAALVLLVPVMAELVAQEVVGKGGLLLYAPSVVVAAVFYSVPVVVLLAVGGLPRRVRRRTGEPFA
jgi:hypothetical protein